MKIFSGIVVSLLLSGLLMSAGCSDAQNKASSAAPSEAPAAAEVEATFVELGSKSCIPCKMMQPVMEQVEKEYAGKVAVVFHDVWTSAGKPYADKYRIQAIPTQIFLDKDGKEFSRHTGFFPFEEIVKTLEEAGVKK